jgi:hypothetical protein
MGWIAGKLMAVVGLIVPAFKKVKAPKGLGTGLRIVLGIVLVLLILVGLWALNSLFKLPESIASNEFIREYYLPIAFLLLLALLWLSYWFYTLLVTEEEGPSFPEIDQAWHEAKDALREAGLGLADLPLFIILGQPEDDERALFAAAQLELEVGPAPARAEAPLHLYATREAIYLTCAGASLTGMFAQSLAGKLPGGQPDPDTAASEDDEFVTMTLTPGARGGIGAPAKAAAYMAQVFRQAEQEGRGLDKLTKAEKRELRSLFRQNNPQRSPLQNADKVATQTASLQYLCRLLVRDRHPFCAINGVLLLVPFAATDSDQDAAFCGDVLYRDLSVTGAGLKVDCPHFVLVCDLETAPGFTEFVQQFSGRERLRRIGSKCPLRPDFRGANGRGPAPEDAPAARMVASLAEWVCNAVVPTFVYRKFGMEGSDKDDRTALVHTNSRMFQLSAELQVRGSRLAGILARGFSARAKGRLLFGGCYLAGTGSNPDSEQGFVRGVIERLPEGQSCVYWTEQTLAEEAAYQWWLIAGWTVLGMLIVLALLAAGYMKFFS